MSNRAAEIVGLRVASKRCRALATSSDDAFASLSYTQLADEIDRMIATREAAIEALARRSEQSP